MSIPEMDMNPEIARKLLEVGEEFRIEGPFFSYEEIKMGNVNHTYKVNYIRVFAMTVPAWQRLSLSLYSASIHMRFSTRLS